MTHTQNVIIASMLLIDFILLVVSIVTSGLKFFITNVTALSANMLWTTAMALCITLFVYVGFMIFNFNKYHKYRGA